MPMLKLAKETLVEMKPWGVGPWANGSGPGEWWDSSLFSRCNGWLGGFPLWLPLVGMGVLLCPTHYNLEPLFIWTASLQQWWHQGHQW